MKDIYDAVTKELKTKRDSEKLLQLWKDLWTEYEAGGLEKVREHIDVLSASPED